MIVATAGHVDHGKTTLVRKLTGMDTDRLPEEKRRGMSIDLGFAYLPVGQRKPIAFVDVPGHERFVRNMVAGIHAVDLALLVVAADDGPMPQTLEHLAILRHLGVAALWPVITKLDLVEPARAREVRGQVAALLDGTEYAGAPFYEDSERLRADLVARADAQRAAPAADAAGFRMPVDRAFILEGIGLVATGTVLQGAVKVGDTLTVMPRGLAVRVRSLRANSVDAASASAGERCALALHGASRDEVVRGDVIAAGGPLPRTRRADIRVRLEPHVAPKAKRPVVAHFGAASCDAQLTMVAGDARFGRLTFPREWTLWHGDRLLLRDAGTGSLLGGGIVLDALPESHATRAARASWLERLEDASAEQALVRAVAEPDGVANLHWLGMNWQQPPEAIARLAAETGLRSFGAREPLATSPATWSAARNDLLEAIRAHHREHPDEAGPALALLRARFAPRYGSALVMAVLDEAVREEALVRWGGHVRLPQHRVALSPEEQALWQRLALHLAPSDSKPARVHELAEKLAIPAKEVEALLVRACHAGHAMRVARNRFFVPETVERMVALARALDAEGAGEGFSAAQFRDRSGLGRNLTIEVLEFLDQCGYTRRRRDRRHMTEGFMEEKRTPVGRPDFKSGERRLTSLGGSTPSSSANSGQP